MKEATYIEDKTFEAIDFTTTALAAGEYDNCRFVNCNFSDANLSGFKLIECSFIDCNLSMVKTDKATLRDVKFKGCKILGMHFESCDQFIFSVALDGCNLSFCSFYKMKMKKMKFQVCIMHEVDFTDTDLTAAVFENCDLLGAKFENSILEKTDFRTSYNYSFDPEINKIKKARFSLAGLPGLLAKYNIDIED